MIQNRKLDVFYHQKHIGTLAEMPDKRVAFQYCDAWRREGFSINPLSLPLTNEVFIPQEKNKNIFHGLHGVFADSLPDAWGELLIRNFLSSINIKVEDLSIIDRLAYIGNTGMGALEYYPSRVADFNLESTDLSFDELAKECETILESKSSEKIDLLYNLAGSSGGTRPKILLNEDGREWIVKFPARTDPKNSGKQEYDYSICAKKCGIIMPETAIIPSKICDGYFKTERFDRCNGNKIFVVSFAGLLNADYNSPFCDYSTFMRLIQFLTKDNLEDKQQMYKQMCFNLLAHNMDDHTKNFSFRFTEENGWRLSPAYDITYSSTYFGEHTTSINGKGKNISDDDVLKVGIDAGLSKGYLIDILEEIRNKTRELRIYTGKASQKEHKKVPI